MSSSGTKAFLCASYPAAPCCTGRDRRQRPLAAGFDFNSISQKHVDFLVCRNEDMSPIFAIELDDWTHESKRVQQRDMFVNNLYAAISLPLLRLDVKESGALERLTARLSDAWFRGVELLEMR
jgi:Protein of unknown function (DUF2726)